MRRSEEAQAFFHAVYLAVQEIPRGRVTTYGHVAYLVGTREFYIHIFAYELTTFKWTDALANGEE